MHFLKCFNVFAFSLLGAATCDNSASLDALAVSFFGENQVGHGGTFRIAPNGGDYAQFATAWMSWQLRGNHQTTMFLGEDCDLCSRPNWKVQKKQIA